MAKKVIVIDSYIGAGAYSKQYVRNMINGSKDELEVNVSSLGGDVDHALNIHDQFADHGNVIINYTGFNASAATLLSLGAKKIRISENSFYLIHKAMSWIDEFGYMNEDQIDEIIQKLEKEKNENAKITLQIAKMYAGKTGKSVKEILDLMKKETWLTADEAKEWGFVDEIYSPAKKENYLENASKVAMIAAAGFPALPRTSQTNQETLALDEEGLFNRLFTRISDAFKPNKNQMKKQFLNVNKALKVDKLEATDEGVFLNEEQLQAVEDRLTAATQAETDRDTARNEISTTNSELDTIDETVATAQGTTAKVAAIKALLAKKPGANSATVDKPGDGDEGSDDEGEGFYDRFSKLTNELKKR